MEKFNLKSNDFQVNVAKSFSLLRKENDFYDVSLVCEGEKIIYAHKVILSASSVFFKNILRKADHSKPMIFLNGIEGRELNSILDYVYQGEVQLFQDELDSFLSVAEKLKIDGLVGGKNDTVDNEEMDGTEIKNSDSDSKSLTPSSDLEGAQKQKLNYDVALKKSIKTVSVLHPTEGTIYDEARRAVDELVMKVEDGWKCRACGKTTKGTSSQIRKHAEIHIEGLAFPCQLCGNTFRSRKALSNHKYEKH